MDVGRLSVYDCSASSPETADGSSITDPVTCWDRPVMSDPTEDITLHTHDLSLAIVTQQCSIFRTRIQHRLDISR